MADAQPVKPKRKGSWRWKLIAFLLLLLLAGGFVGYTWITLHLTFSSGERTGYVQKFAKLGVVCKTWEGELSSVNAPGAAPEKFVFTVPDDAVANRINDATGKRVALTYEEHRGVPTKCFGESGFFVTSVRVVGQ